MNSHRLNSKTNPFKGSDKGLIGFFLITIMAYALFMIYESGL